MTTPYEPKQIETNARRNGRGLAILVLPGEVFQPAYLVLPGNCVGVPEDRKMTEPRKRTALTPRVVPKLTDEEEAFLSAIYAPENAHLFTLEAVSKAYAHTKRLRPDMPEPHQRTRALLKTRYFLEELTRAGDTPRVPAKIRETARRLLRDYPGFDEIELAHKALPELFGPVVQRQAEGLPATKLNHRK